MEQDKGQAGDGNFWCFGLAQEKAEDYKKQLDELSNKVEQLMQEKASLEKRSELAHVP